MTKRLGYALVFALVGSSLSLSACSDDDSAGDDNGGSAGASGSDAGSKTGGSASGGSSNKAGANSGGKAGGGTAGTSSDGGTPNAGGAADTGGAAGGVIEGGANGNSAGAAGSDAGAAGADGAGEPPLVYACGSDTQYKKVCSAKVAAACPDPTDCADCVAQVSDEHDGSITGCATCDALVDQYYQCGVAAFEGGNSAAGMLCIDGFGADFSDECSAFFFDYFDCGTYLNDHACPATWPQ
jgi:hypothetical protein